MHIGIAHREKSREEIITYHTTPKAPYPMGLSGL